MNSPTESDYLALERELEETQEALTVAERERDALAFDNRLLCATNNSLVQALDKISAKIGQLERNLAGGMRHVPESNSDLISIPRAKKALRELRPCPCKDFALSSEDATRPTGDKE